MFWTPLDKFASFARPFLLLKSSELVRKCQCLTDFRTLLKCPPGHEVRTNVGAQSMLLFEFIFVACLLSFWTKGSASSGIASFWIHMEWAIICDMIVTWCTNTSKRHQAYWWDSIVAVEHDRLTNIGRPDSTPCHTNVWLWATQRFHFGAAWPRFTKS